MARGSCPQTSSFPGLQVYHCLAYSYDWSENPFSQNSLLYSDEELDGTPSSTGSFDLVSYPSRLWETLPVVYTGRSTFAFLKYFAQGFGVVKLNSILVGLW
jgi:hypothetical protein